jgi:hypothetical protein
MDRKLLALFLCAAAFTAAATPLRANQDAVQFFNNIDVTPDNPVHDVVCFFCSVNVQGKASGDIVVFFGGVRLNGEADHDVVNFFGNVNATDDSSIGGDLVSFFGSVRLGQNVSVGKDVVAMFGVVHAPASASVGGDRVSFPLWIATAPLLVIFLIVFLIVNAFRAHRERQFARGYPFPPRP